MLASPRDLDPPTSESAFVYGRDSTPTLTLAVGLALRRHGSFSWADCAATAQGASLESQGVLSKGRSRTAGDGLDALELSVPRWSADVVERVLVPESRMDSLRLMGYLALPSLLQELAAMSTSPSGESFIVLTNIDSLEHGLRANVLGRADVHRSLRDARVSLFVTSRNAPTRGEARAFDRVFRIEIPWDALWSEGTVRIEKDGGSEHRTRSIPLRFAWDKLGLDPALLPPP